MSKPKSTAGSNLPSFQAVQLEFSAHIRNPEEHAIPAGIEDRRMKIYRDLFYNNIEGFLAGAYPVSKKLLGDDRWHGLARQFVHRHGSQTPYFLEISQEFLEFLDQAKPVGLPDFFLELCHYEWVELALRVDPRDIPEDGIDSQGDPVVAVPVRSPLCWPLVYNYPVHQITAHQQPDGAPQGLTYLMVYRDRQDQVRFMVSNPMTHRLLELLDGQRTGQQALGVLAEELVGADSAKVLSAGADALGRLQERSIIAGVSLVNAIGEE